MFAIDHSSLTAESMWMCRSTRNPRPNVYESRAPSGSTSAERSRRTPSRGRTSYRERCRVSQAYKPAPRRDGPRISPPFVATNTRPDPLRERPGFSGLRARVANRLTLAGQAEACCLEVHLIALGHRFLHLLLLRRIHTRAEL